ncbi:MAG: amidase [Solirubrobacteraceae bacterium]|nr:amidase [Solirubrobacteraceae bacterium]
MSTGDLMFRPVTELAAMVRRGELYARELVDVSLGRIDALQPVVNAFVDVDHEGARAAANAIGPGDERPFAGVPIAIKNNRAVRGLRLTLGAALTGDHTPQHDHNVTRRLREAGFVIVGTTCLPEWGIMAVTETRRFGPTRNPWDLGRTPGGSSGGSAAAVAAGMVPIASANDGGGSTRIPAACCGLVGLKPQRGRISHAPDAGEQFLVQDGVLTRTVAETALLLDVLAGPQPGDASWAPPPAEPFATAAAREPGRLRIAVTTSMPLLDAELDPACERAVRDAAQLLAGLGHEVVEADPPWHVPGLLEQFTALFGPAVCAQIAVVAMIAGREPAEEDMEPLSWALWQRCKRIDAVQAAVVTYGLQAFARAITVWAGEYDALLTPALAQPPVAIGELDPCGPDPMQTFRRSGDFTPYTAISNVTGTCAISLPLYEREDGLPLAVQLIGRPAGEGALLALAAQLEAARPWAGRRAPTPPGAWRAAIRASG